MTGLRQPEPDSATAIWRSAILVWLALIFLMFVNLGLAYVPLGSLNAAISVGIACLMALLVVVFSMHLRRPVPMLRLAGAATLLWLMFMFVLTLSDLLLR